MTTKPSNGGPAVYDPRGVVDAAALPLAPRADKLAGLRLGVLDNSKWNAGKLLRRTVAILREEIDFAAVNHYIKESFSLAAGPELIAGIAAENDLVLTAVGD